MDKKFGNGWSMRVLMAMLLVMVPAAAGAFINGDTGTASGTSKTFNFTAKDGYIIMGDGTSAYMWGYASQTNINPVCPAGNCMQYPGPTLIVNQGDTVVVNLTNSIPTRLGNTSFCISIVFPGQPNVIATGGGAGCANLITQEAPPGGGTATYTFIATNPGTYLYHSGTQPDLQVEMGLQGALIVRPVNGVNGCVLPALQPFPALGNDPNFAPVPTQYLSASRGYAYCTVDAYYDHEYLYMVTELDPVLHRMVEYGQMSQVDTTTWHPTDWLINGRDFPDTMGNDYDPWVPAQPYAALLSAHPGENFLIRFIGGGRALHPMHPHGQNHNVIARDGRLLQSAAGALAGRVDLPISDFTTTTVPGMTADALWGPWTGIKLNWDIYGHANNVDANGVTTAPSCTASAEPAEYLPDHCKPLPVLFPAPSKLSFGQMWGGSPFLGVPADIPAIDPNTGDYHSNQNPMAAQSFMFHSHNEREITTNNIFIGGAATMTMIQPYTDVNGNPIIIP